MPSPQSSRTPNKGIIFLFLNPKFQQLGSKVAIKSNASALQKTDGVYVNGNNIIYSANVRTLCKHGSSKETLHILENLKKSHLDSSSYACMLQECLSKKAFPEGKLIHAHIIQTGFECHDIFLWTLLVTIYAKLGYLVDGHKMFDEMPERNAVSWTVMIAAYVRHGFGREAMALFRHMQHTGVQPNQFTFASVIPACASLIDLEDVYDEIRRLGYESDVFVVNGLVDMYAKCGSIEKARDLFDKMPLRSVVSWNAMIAGYAQKGYFKEALKLFNEMPERNVASWNATIAGYAHNGLVEEAVKLFREMPMANVVSWTAMITGYAQNGKMEEALKLFQEMPERNVVSWNAMIAGYAQNGLGQEALKLFGQMKSSGVKPNSQTFVGVLPVCADLAALEQGKEIHNDVMGSKCQSNIFVGNALVDMYAKCGSIENARHVFDKMSHRDVVTWNSMIAGYAQNGLGDEALKLLYEMQLSGMKPNSVTVMSVLSLCINLAALQHGKEIHGFVIRGGLESDVVVGSAIVHMYAKCGNIIYARQVFDRIPCRDLALWNTMVSGYAMHGHVEETLKVFYEMQQARITPDGITFTSVLSACSHAGLVNEGWQYFRSMSHDYGIKPTVEHYACMVDLLGRSGCLSEAQHFIDNMPFEPDACVLGALLGACRMHGNIELAEHVAERLFVLEPQNAGNYVLLSNIYATAGRGDDVAKVRKMMRDRGLIKNPGCSWIEVDNRVHAFYVGDKSHPQAEMIYTMLKSLAGQMKDAGYVPNMNFVLQDVEKEDKGLVLYGHSEKLAIIFGLINTCPGTPIRVINNLRMCGDCHTTTKFISGFEEREIFVRDTNRFHHFRDGICSCGDYW